MTQIIPSVSQWLDIRKSLSFDGKTIGFVPTMGALHAGHVSLLETSHKANAISVLSIFVNPTQFNDPHDLRNYPRTLEADLELAKQANVDFILLPKDTEMYADQYRFKIEENQLSKRFCGAHRPGHFPGMLTIVMKLLQLVRPTRAYFGEKDYQQYLLVKEMAEAFFLETQIVACPTLRADDGLAMRVFIKGSNCGGSIGRSSHRSARGHK